MDLSPILVFALALIRPSVLVVGTPVFGGRLVDAVSMQQYPWVVYVVLFLALFVRLWFLQGIDRQEFEAASVSNRLRVIHEEAPRGRILDRNGKVLVDNRTSIVVALDREPLRKMEPQEREAMFVDLADTLVSFGVPAKVSDVQKAFDDKRYAPQAYVPVAEDVSEDVEIYLAERADRFPGVVVERKAVRVYPYGKAAVHVLGYVGEINEDELVARGGTVPGASQDTTTAEHATAEHTAAVKDGLTPEQQAWWERNRPRHSRHHGSENGMEL